MKITKLVQNLKHENLVDVYIDDDFFKTLDKNLVIELGLFKDQEFTQATLAKIEWEGSLNKLYNLCVKLISARPRSVYEIQQYLTRRKTSKQFSEILCEKLQNHNYLDDFEFAKWWIDNRNSFKAKSVLELRQELLRKGLTGEIIDQVISKYMTKEQESDNILTIAQKKLKLLQNNSLSGKQVRDKLIQYLQRRGFAWDTIMQILDQLTI